MEELCEYIILSYDYKMDEIISFKYYNEINNLDECINKISEYLDIAKSAIIINNEKLFISFKFKDRVCQFIGIQKDYICVHLMPISHN
jgi:hypothetical protein